MTRDPIDTLTLTGVGLYTVSDAERLVGISRGKLHRWLRGHVADGRPYAPLWERQIEIGDDTILGFLDLLQSRVVAALIAEGLSPQKVRKAILLARDIIASDHPFVSARFRTDGKRLLLQSLTPGEDDHLIDLFSGGQYVMRTVVEPSLKGVEFDGTTAARWYPFGVSSGVVLDPNRQFGQPIDVISGVPTRILASAAMAEGSVERAARMFEVPVKTIRQAVAFEKRLAA